MTARNPGISLDEELILRIDKERIATKEYKNRSDYAQSLIERDLKYKTIDYFIELINMVLAPMLFFVLFFILSFLTRGILFIMFMLVCGGWGVVWCFMFYKKYNKKQR